ncbi:GNAT family N-acetyltransferase [Aliterella atlantica]|uniref:GCN5 family acetyltransferase n=1 Tax=Aliterella atlantica CENA595 TaxID=1618023 RepID=A0A0D8ZXD3_9CYAN|nr:GNAT family N-acetyltransferase [Aliterella atlantica]KJH73420.1 GCN5 family acetyltransferase [Aliterella atlantica CENA595]
MKIRSAQLEDIETLFNIRVSVEENHLSREELAALGVTPKTVARMLQTNCHAWLAEIDSQAIAFIMANAQEGSIFVIAVLPAFAGRGVGRALMAKAEEWLRSQGFAEIWLLTANDPKLRAYGFYQHLGWIADESQPDELIKFTKRQS